jgi:hypothetical protein
MGAMKKYGKEQSDAKGINKIDIVRQGIHFCKPS